MSRGAQTHHFPTRESWLIASVREIVNRYQFDLMHQDRRELTPHAFFDFLWDATFNDSLLTCWVEAMVAARTDPVLKQQVQITDAAAIAAMKSIGVERSGPHKLDTTTTPSRAISSPGMLPLPARKPPP